MSFGPNTEGRDRLASDSVRVKLCLQIFQVQSEVQDVLLVNFVFSHGTSPISALVVQVVDLLLVGRAPKDS
jgi:hypothetical protein